jgi:hypothetical protein
MGVTRIVEAKSLEKKYEFAPADKQLKWAKLDCEARSYAILPGSIE